MVVPDVGPVARRRPSQDGLERPVEGRRALREPVGRVVRPQESMAPEVDGLEAGQQGDGYVVPGDDERLAGEVGAVEPLAVDVLVELLGVRREAVRDGGAQEREERRERVPRDLQALQSHVRAARGVADERRGQAVGELGRHQQRNLNIEVLDHEAEEVPQLVHRDGNVHAEEVPAVEALPALGVDERVVVGAVHLRLDLRPRGLHPVHNGPEVLGKAAQGVAVLDRLLAAVRVFAAELVAAEVRAP
mmetsp:Transcript_12141/g.36626  ORF Transcript_12141/g.36626 Transcript_12141/m.36626 type:complete len:247 (-) Transcript_12141:683-1423(-)